MKYSLKPKELHDIKNFLENSPVAKNIREYRSWNFNIGDVLIRHKVKWDGSKELDVVSDKCPIPVKFKVVHIDELGIPWVKRISVRRGLGNKIYCLMNYTGSTHTWEVDPEQIDSIVLGYEYDPRTEYKKMRSENPDYGGK